MDFFFSFSGILNSVFESATWLKEYLGQWIFGYR